MAFAAATGGEMVATSPGSDSLTGDSREDPLPPLILGVGDGRGFGGHISAAKLALADALDAMGDGFELRIGATSGTGER